MIFSSLLKRDSYEFIFTQKDLTFSSTLIVFSYIEHITSISCEFIDKNIFFLFFTALTCFQQSSVSLNECDMVEFLHSMKLKCIFLKSVSEFMLE